MKILTAALSILTLAVHAFAADAKMDIKDKAGKVQWNLQLEKSGTKEYLHVFSSDGSHPVVQCLEVQSDGEKNAVMTGISRMEEMARNAKSQGLTTPMQKTADTGNKRARNSVAFAFVITSKGEHEMHIGGQPYTSERVASLKELLRNLSSYASQLRKATTL